MSQCLTLSLGVLWPKPSEWSTGSWGSSKKYKIYKLSPLLGGDGLRRLQGGLQHSGLPEEEKHLVIIPQSHLRVLLALHAHVMLKHAGVNTMLVSVHDQYWLVGGRYVCKRVKRFCVSCQRQDVGGDQAMAPLPHLRVTSARPFPVSGLDHAGPLFCCDFPGKSSMCCYLHVQWPELEIQACSLFHVYWPTQ